MDYFRLLMQTTGPVDEDDKAKKKDKLMNETIPFYFSKFEAIVKENKGHFVNGKVSEMVLVHLQDT